MSKIIKSKAIPFPSHDWSDFEYDHAYIRSELDEDLFDAFYFIDTFESPIKICSNKHYLLKSPKVTSESPLFHDISARKCSADYLPLLLVLQTHQSKTYFESLRNTWYKWTLHVKLENRIWGELIGDLSLKVKFANEVCSDDVVSKLHNTKLYKALEIIYDRLIHLRQITHQYKYTQYKVYDVFYQWKAWSNLLSKLERRVPFALRVLVLLPHDLLWNIFATYCIDKRKLPTKLQLQNPSYSPQPNQYNQPNLSHQQQQQQQYRSSCISSDKHLKYRKKILTIEEFWVLFKDCRICPILFGKRKLEMFVHEINTKYKTMNATLNTSQHSLDTSLEIVESTSSPSSSQVQSPARNRVTLTSSTKKPLNPSISDTNKLPRIVSFNTFLEIMWKVIGDCLEIEITPLEIYKIRKVIREEDSVVSRQAMYLYNSNNWIKFVYSVGNHSV